MYIYKECNCIFTTITYIRTMNEDFEIFDTNDLFYKSLVRINVNIHNEAMKRDRWYVVEKRRVFRAVILEDDLCIEYS